MLVPTYSKKLSVGEGIAGGAVGGFLMGGAFQGCGFYTPASAEEAGIMVFVCTVLFGVGGAFLADSEAAKPQEQQQERKVTYTCPYCRKAVEVVSVGLATRLTADVQSLACPVCGNVAVVDWQLPR